MKYITNSYTKRNKQILFIIKGCLIILSCLIPVGAEGEEGLLEASAIHCRNLPSLPNPLGVAGPFVGVDGEALLVAGGANFPEAPPWKEGKKVWQDRVYALPSPDGGWVTAGTLPKPLAYGVSVNTERGVLCIGGGDASAHYADTFFMRYRDGALAFEPGPALPGPVAFGCGVRAGDTVYVAGGRAQPDAPRPLDTLWSLDLTKLDAGWQEHETWPGVPRMLSVAGTDGESFFLFSGVDLVPDEEGVSQRVYLSDAYRFRPGTGWTACAQLPLPAAAAPNPAIYRSGHLYVLGGDTGRLASTEPGPGHPGFDGIVVAYDVASGAWQPAGKLLKNPSNNLWPPVTTTLTPWAGGYALPTGEARPGIRTPQVLLIEIGGGLVHARKQ